MNGQTPDPILPVSEAEADDELENDVVPRRSKPATRRNQIRQTLEETIHKRSSFPREKAERRRDSRQGLESLNTLPSLERRRSSLVQDRWSYSSADEDDVRLGIAEKPHFQRDNLSINHERTFMERQAQVGENFSPSVS